MAERIDRLSPPTDVFRAVAENAIQLSGSGSVSNDLLDELCSNENLAGVSIHLYDMFLCASWLHCHDIMLAHKLLLFFCLMICAQSHQN